MTQSKKKSYPSVLAVTAAVYSSHLHFHCFLPRPWRSRTPKPVLCPKAADIDELIRVLWKTAPSIRNRPPPSWRRKEQPGFSPLSALTEILKAKGVITPGEAERVAKKAASAPAQAVTLHYEPTQKDLDRMTESVTDEIKKDVREQVKAEIKQEVLDETKKDIQSAAAPEWTKRIRFGGDIRLRYEGDFFKSNNGEFLNPSNPTQLLNSQTEQDRSRVRARLGATADLVDNVEAGMRSHHRRHLHSHYGQPDNGHLFQ